MSYRLYYKGKPLPEKFVTFVKKYARRKINIENPKALHDFWEEHKEKFVKLNNGGLPSIPHGTNKLVEILQELNRQGKDFYIDMDKKLHKVSCREMILQVVMVENFVVSILGSPFFLIKYYETFDRDDIIIKLPNIKKLSKLAKRYE